MNTSELFHILRLWKQLFLIVRFRVIYIFEPLSNCSFVTSVFLWHKNVFKKCNSKQQFKTWAMGPGLVGVAWLAREDCSELLLSWNDSSHCKLKASRGGGGLKGRSSKWALFRQHRHGNCTSGAKRWRGGVDYRCKGGGGGAAVVGVVIRA